MDPGKESSPEVTIHQLHNDPKETVRVSVENEEINYIPYGDERQECYRLATFWFLPSYLIMRVKFWLWAEAGFYSTGKNDNVRCFGCGVDVESFTEKEDPFSRDLHKDDCALAAGEQCGNVPLITPRTTLAEIRKYLFTKWPGLRKITRNEQQSEELAQSECVQARDHQRDNPVREEGLQDVATGCTPQEFTAALVLPLPEIDIRSTGRSTAAEVNRLSHGAEEPNRDELKPSDQEASRRRGRKRSSSRQKEDSESKAEPEQS